MRDLMHLANRQSAGWAATAILILACGCPLLDPCNNVDCNDGDFCTEDSCAGGECSNEVIEGCCRAASDCDDENVCTIDVCHDIDADTGTGRCRNTAIGPNCCNDEGDCSEGEVCANNECVAACETNDDCADDEICDSETGQCEPAAECASNEDCDEGQICDLDTGECIGSGVDCTLDEDCDDQDICTLDTCEGGACTIVQACDDGRACTDDSCDPETGECTNELNCEGGEQCDAQTGECEPAQECAADVDCESDGFFCNGAETCGDNGLCESGGDPCPAGQTCNEATDSCAGPSAPCIQFTTAVETKNGTGENDQFCASWNAATQSPTLQTGDVGTGATGDDTLTATFAFSVPTTVQPTLSGIETMTVTDQGTAATTLSATSITGLTTFRAINSTNGNALTVSNLPNVLDVELQNTGSSLTLQYTAGATTGTNSMDVTLSNVSGGDLTIETAAANGIESLVVSSNGTGNTLDSIVQTTGTTMTAMTVTGTAPFAVDEALPATLATVTATNASGGITLDVSGNTGTMTVTGGAGNDTIEFGPNYAPGDTVTGGTGINTLVLTSVAAGVAANQAGVTGFSVLTITDGLVNAMTSSRFGSITVVNLLEGFTGSGDLTAASGTTINLGMQGAATDSTQPGTVTGGAGTTDSVTVVLRDHDTKALTFSGVEAVTLQSSPRDGGNPADDGFNLLDGALTVSPTSGTSSLNLIGTASLTISGSVTSGTLNATAFTGDLIMQLTSAASITISSGAGNDTIFGSASADILSAGSGTNVIEGRSGIDTIGPLSAGVDTIRINIEGFAGSDRKLVTGFTAGVGGDLVNVDANDLAFLAGTDNFATGASLQSHSTAGALVVAATTVVVRITSNTVANFTAANSLNGTNLLAAAGDPDNSITVANDGSYLFLIGDAAGNSGVYFGDSGGDLEISAAELTLVSVLQSTPVATLVVSNFSNAN